MKINFPDIFSDAKSYQKTILDSFPKDFQKWPISLSKTLIKPQFDNRRNEMASFRHGFCQSGARWQRNCRHTHKNGTASSRDSPGISYLVQKARSRAAYFTIASMVALPSAPLTIPRRTPNHNLYFVTNTTVLFLPTFSVSELPLMTAVTYIFSPSL